MSLCNYLQSCSIDTQRNKTCIACTNFELHINDQGNGINILCYRSCRLAIKIINTFLFLQCTVTSITTVLIKGFHYSSNTLIYFFFLELYHDNMVELIWLFHIICTTTKLCSESRLYQCLWKSASKILYLD